MPIFNLLIVGWFRKSNWTFDRQNDIIDKLFMSKIHKAAGIYQRIEDKEG